MHSSSLLCPRTVESDSQSFGSSSVRAKWGEHISPRLAARACGMAVEDQRQLTAHSGGRPAGTKAASATNSHVPCSELPCHSRARKAIQ